MDEKIILDGCRRGDKTSWDRFVERYSKLIWWAIHETLKGSRFSAQTGLAEEIFQDLFSRILNNREIFDLHDPRCLPKFLTVTACRETMNKIRSLSRREGRFESLEDALQGPEGEQGHAQVQEAATEHGAEAVLRSEREAVIKEVLQSLGPRDRAIVESHFYDDKTHR